LHLGDGADAGDHSGRGERQLGRRPGQGLAGSDGQEVGAEPVDLGQQTRLGGGGEPEHGYDRGDSDRDPERRECGAQAAGAKTDAGNPGEVGDPQPGRLGGRVGAHRRVLLMTDGEIRQPPPDRAETPYPKALSAPS
jgi:hypothetical protein